MELDNRKISFYIDEGYSDRYWYQECENVLRKLFKDDWQLAAKMLAATSINTSITSNVTLFKRAWYQYHNDLPLTGYLPNIEKQLAQIKAGTGLTGQKICAFERAMTGDPDAVVVDLWLARAFGVEKRYFRKESELERSGGVSEKTFKAVTLSVQIKAYSMGVQPREASAMIWSGIRKQFFPKEKTRYSGYLIKNFSTLF